MSSVSPLGTSPDKSGGLKGPSNTTSNSEPESLAALLCAVLTIRGRCSLPDRGVESLRVLGHHDGTDHAPAAVGE